MQPDDVEFFDDPSLPSSSLPDGPVAPEPSHRLRWLRLVLVAAVLAGGLGWVITRHDGNSRPIATPTTSVPAPPVQTLRTLPLIRRIPLVTSASVPRDVAAAIKRYQPGASISVVSMLRVSDKLLESRRITVHDGQDVMLLRITRYARSLGDPAPIGATIPGLESTLVRIERADFVVDVQWMTLPGSVVPIAGLQALADDPRLEALV